MKTIHEYFALTEDEYKITILSYADICKEDYIDLIEFALQKYDLRELEIKPAEPFQTNPPQFPTLTFGTMYRVEATLGTLPRGMYEQIKLEIAQSTRVPIHYLFVSEDGNIPQVKSCNTCDDEALLKQAMGDSPRDFPEDDISVQTLVGQKSVEEVMKNMSDRRKAREENSKAVAESIQYKTTHTVLREHTGQSLRKGVYEFHVIDGEVKIGKRADDNAQGVFVSSLKQLQETLKPEVPTFAEKYRLSSYLNEDEDMADINPKERAVHAFTMLNALDNLKIAIKPQFDNGLHKLSVETADLEYTGSTVTIRAIPNPVVPVKKLMQIVHELECEDIEMSHDESTIVITFIW